MNQQLLLQLNRFFFIALLISGAFSSWLLAPPHATPSVMVGIFLFSYGVLVLGLPAMLTGGKKAFTWLSFILLLYVCVFVLQVIDPPPRRWAGISNLTFTLLLLITTMLYLKAGSRAESRSTATDASGENSTDVSRPDD